MKVNVYHNGDDVFIAWKPDGFIPDVAASHCYGGGMASRRLSQHLGRLRRRRGQGRRTAGIDQLAHSEIPMDRLHGQPGRHAAVSRTADGRPGLRDISSADTEKASEWTDEIRSTHEVIPEDRGLFQSRHRGRAMGLTPARHHRDDLRRKKLRTVIETPDDPFRNYLAGPLGARLFELLARRRKRNARSMPRCTNSTTSSWKRLGEVREARARGAGQRQRQEKGEDQNSAAREELKVRSISTTA